MTPRGPVPSNRLAGRTALVMGGGSASDAISVGQACALGYAAGGARVAIVDARLDNAERTAARIDGAYAFAADITDDAALQTVIHDAAGRLGSIDILHNNVGMPVIGPFADFDGQAWRRGMDVNCIGAAQAIRFALPHLIESRGVIVNVSSVAAIRHTGMNYAIYNASKAALDQMTITVALEYAGRGVRANAILPGYLDTEMGRSLATPDEVDQRRRRSPTGEQGDVWDVANAATFLASDEARYINGHLLVVDGGLSRRC